MKKLVLMSLVISSMLFNGCGDDSKSNNSFETKPLTTKNSCSYSGVSLAFNDFEAKIKNATDGDIKLDCIKEDGLYSSILKFSKNINSLTVENVIKVEEISLNSNEFEGFDISTYDYKSGTKNLRGSIFFKGGEEKVYDCVETYPSVDSQIVTDAEGIESLLDGYFDNNDIIETTCPTFYYESSVNPQEFTKVKLNLLQNYTLTDDKGKKHLITTESYLEN